MAPLVEDPVPATAVGPSLNGSSNGYNHVSGAQKLKDASASTTTEVKSLPQEGQTATAAEKKETTRPRFELEEHPVDQVRDIKVGVIGAGLAGVTAGILLPAKLPGLDLRIYEKNPDVVCCSRSYINT